MKTVMTAILLTLSTVPCLSASAQTLTINYLDADGAQLNVGKNLFHSSFSVYQKVEKSWSILPLGTIGLPYPKHSIKKEPVVFKFLSTLHSLNRLTIPNNDKIRIQSDALSAGLAFTLDRRATCGKKKIIMPLQSYARIDGKKVDCADLMNMSGTPRDLQSHLRKLPRIITCTLDLTKAEVEEEFAQIIANSTQANCKNWPVL